MPDPWTLIKGLWTFITGSIRELADRDAASTPAAPATPDAASTPAAPATPEPVPEPVLTKWAKRLKYAFQAAIGIFIICAIGWQVFHLERIEILKLVGTALIFSAVIDLAYMLFTPGPDEAMDPVIVALAAAVLILISEFKEKVVSNGYAPLFETRILWPVLSIIILVSAIGFLFLVRETIRQRPRE